MDNFERIKNLSESKISINEDYSMWGYELYHNLRKLGISDSEDFENDIFKIVPYDWDGLQDCTCYYDKEIDRLYDNGVTEDNILKFENTHMHDIDCNFRRTNFHHKSTGVSVEWRKSMSRFEYINKDISYEEWQEIVQDCVKSVLKDKYESTINLIKINCIIDFKDHPITETQFYEKIDKFISDNGWSIKND